MKGKFLGFRLKEAREIRELTLSSLAGLIGVTKQAVSQYEAGVAQPSPEKIIRLLQILRLPSQFFTKERSFLIDEVGVPNFRKFAAASKYAREEVKTKSYWLADSVRTLKNYVNFPKLNLPTFDLPADFRDLDDEIEEYALELRKFWNLGLGPISNMVRLLENNGIFVSRFAFDDRVDAFSIRIGEDAYVILGNSGTTCVRSRLDAAHELAHLVLHRNITEDDQKDPKNHKKIETQAFRFGAAFLMPMQTFSRELLSINNEFLVHLKERWKVSKQAMMMRARDLGLLSDSQLKYFYRLNSAKRTKEELDDLLPLEEPLLLKRTMELLVANAGMSKRDLLDLLAFDEGTVIELFGLNEDFFEQEEDNVIDITVKRPL
ncbi:helix-turn-helix domain-containing protein [Leptospira wolffii]|uniref:helix-turn-helix domain-containing protein n=1 Tax=Leptospira wolffii TaxID=409998 RepID=UPI0002EB22C7|nr:ImmA/IrrE family metallo-endopeptidase [Leptospira wolffii]EPG64642.1 PF06114 domain protein [Leptospira wolffii serovar Khorat str. Khorat-H2]